MGAGPAKFLLDGNGSDGQIIPHSGRCLHPDTGHEPEAKSFDAHGSFESRHQAGAGREEDSGIVSVTAAAVAKHHSVTVTILNTRSPLPPDSGLPPSSFK